MFGSYFQIHRRRRRRRKRKNRIAAKRKRKEQMRNVRSVVRSLAHAGIAADWKSENTLQKLSLNTCSCSKLFNVRIGLKITNHCCMNTLWRPSTQTDATKTEWRKTNKQRPRYLSFIRTSSWRTQIWRYHFHWTSAHLNMDLVILWAEFLRHLLFERVKRFFYLISYCFPSPEKKTMQ